MQSGTKVRITKGKFKGLDGTVVTVRTDKDGTTRVQVQTLAGLFSYMATSLSPIADATTSATL